MSASPIQHLDSVPKLLRRSDSESSSSSTASSQTLGTPFDRIVNRADGDLGGEPGLTADSLVGAISELLFEDQSLEFKFTPTCTPTFTEDKITWKMQPLLDGPTGGLQPRFNHGEVQQLCATLKKDYSMKIETKPVHMSRLDYKPSSYHVTVPKGSTESTSGQEAAPKLRRNYASLSLSQKGKIEPRPTPEDENEVEKMDEHTFTAAVDSKLNEIVDDMDALYFS